MRMIIFEVSEAEYQRLKTLAVAHHEKMNAFLAERDLPQESQPPSVNEFARARLLVAMEMDEEIAAAVGGGRWTTAA